MKEISELKKIIRDQLMEYLSIYKEEEEKVKFFLDFIESNDDLYGRKNSFGHITASGWIINKEGNLCLLNHHKTMDKWVQTGGHIEKGETPFEAALREGMEESGIDTLETVSETIMYIERFLFPKGKDGGPHYHYDIRYLFKADNMDYTVSSESVDLKWVDMNDLNLYSDEEATLFMEKRTKEILEGCR